MIFIHSNYRPDNFGGVEKVVSQIISIAKHQDDDVVCFFGSKNNSFEFISHIRYIGRAILLKIGGAPFLSFGNLYFFWLARKSKLIIFQEPFPSLWPALFLLKILYRVPVIVLIHANPVAPKFIMYLYYLLRSCVFYGSICVSTSPNLLNKVKSNLFTNNLCIPLTIPLGTHDNKKILDLSNKYVLYLGRIAEYKGVGNLVHAAALLPDIEFIIAGSGVLSENIKSYIESYSLKNVNFIDRFISETEKLQLLEGCQFLVFPSTSENEAFGLVQLEAMRYGKAIINTWLDSGVNFVAPDGLCAITVNKSNPIELSNAIRLLWENEVLRLKLGMNGLNRFELCFSSHLFEKSWAQLIKDSYDNKKL